MQTLSRNNTTSETTFLKSTSSKLCLPSRDLTSTGFLERCSLVKMSLSSAVRNGLKPVSYFSWCGLKKTRFWVGVVRVLSLCFIPYISVIRRAYRSIMVISSLQRRPGQWQEAKIIGLEFVESKYRAFQRRDKSYTVHCVRGKKAMIFATTTLMNDVIVCRKLIN